MKFLPRFKQSASNTVDGLSTIEALGQGHAIIWYDRDGAILEINENFQKVLGYGREEVIGQNHRIFTEPSYASSPEYTAFWEKLRSGEVVTGRYKSINKEGDPVWTESSYCPMVDQDGVVEKVVQLAIDVTQRENRRADIRSKVDAFSRSYAIIEFDLKGNILSANEAFTKTTGYTLREIQGKHHSMFVEPEYARSAEYQEFWRALGRGVIKAGDFKRVAKGGGTIWLQASYNPSLDVDGNAVKVIKHATDVTLRKQAINELSEKLERLAGGDLSCTIPQSIDGEYASLRDAFNDTTARLRQMVGEIQSTSRKIVDETNSITDGSSELANRAEGQASSLEETAATMEQMTASIKANADNAADANANAGEAAKRAERGGSIVRDAIGAMEEIEGSSSKISDIISVIESIAFQTNLLALNAAVEAARAGDAGKGFAVVASEVRTLAQRSSEAAKDITGLIQESTEHVTKGADLVRQTGTALDEISGAVSGVVSNIADIAAAGQEQSSGVEEVTAAVTSMDQTTQQNSALAEQSAANARRLSEEAVGLGELIGYFRLSDREQAADDAWRAFEKAAPAPKPAAAPPVVEEKAAPEAPREPMQAAEPTAQAGGSWAEF
ncbi:MAG: methyl-accepting chemotaxis protein [Pseudomonadota bacterium]